MSLPSSVQIKEANAHLAALHHRVAELESTIRQQTHNLIRKDTQHQITMRDIVEAKNREIKEIQDKLAQTEADMKRLKASIREKDREMEQLRHHSHLLDQMCRSRPMLNALVSLMTQADGIFRSPSREQYNTFPSVPDCPTESDEDEDPNIDPILRGTKV